ncbi:unnamed protein product [Pocillopora meandrina]|uniref:ShKT domain-containing protein n=1 Tax=Pocillopora meandrina TaxID=46732 RepID=A0AAU9W1D4_9CNID|nr:unnamed protein product [Pocillopora meandrina]
MSKVALLLLLAFIALDVKCAPNFRRKFESDPDAVPRSSDCYDFKPIECQLYKTCASLTARENCPRTCRMCEDFA